MPALALRRVVAIVALGLAASTSVPATPVTYAFAARLDSGPLQGTTFDGTFAFDPAGASPVGREFLPLLALDFTLLGQRFMREQISQGGQAILDDGALSLFTAAFFPPARDDPVSAIAFGFGGPLVIGYRVRAIDEIGLGSYAISATPVPEPSVAALLALGLVAAGWARKRARR